MAQLRIKRSGVKSQPALQIIFKSSQASYTIESKWKSADVFLVGGGGGGQGGECTTGSATGGGIGGGSGYTLTSKNITLASHNIVISVGGGGNGGYGRNNEDNKYIMAGVGGISTIKINNSDISTRTQVPRSNTPMDGGSGGGAPYYKDSFGGGCAGGSDGSDGNKYTYQSSNTYGTGQHTTTKAFEEPNGPIYAGAGGGGGGGTNHDLSGGSGGNGGGGNGGGYGGVAPQSGGANAGGGGGGGYGYRVSSNFKTSGARGGSGIVIIRLYKNSDRPTDIDWTENTIVVE